MLWSKHCDTSLQVELSCIDAVIWNNCCGPEVWAEWKEVWAEWKSQKFGCCGLAHKWHYGLRSKKRLGNHRGFYVFAQLFNLYLLSPPCKNLKWTLSNWSGLIKIPSLPFINSDGKSQIFWLPRAKEESLCGLSQHNMGRGGRVI